jgi:large subunit ribosomal protein L13
LGIDPSRCRVRPKPETAPHKTKLGKHMIRKLRVYAGEKHPHQAQKPVAMELTNI